MKVINLGDISNIDAITNFKKRYEEANNIDDPVDVSDFFDSLHIYNYCMMKGTKVMPFNIIDINDERYLINVESDESNREILINTLESMNYELNDLKEIDDAKDLINSDVDDEIRFFIDSRWYKTKK